MENNYYEEMINIKDLLLYVVKKWKTIIISCLIGLLVGCFFSFFLMYSNKPENVLKKLNRLTNDELNINNIIQYADYVSLYDKEVEYSSNSLLMKADPNNIYNGELTYSISALENDIDRISDYYDGLLSRDNNMDKLAELFDDEYQPYAINELVIVNFSVKSTNELSLNSSVKNGTLTATVHGISEDFTKKILNKIEELINDANKEVISTYPSVAIDKVKNNISYGYDNWISSNQTNKIDIRQNILNSLTTIKSKLRKNELLYYDYYFDYDNSFGGKMKFSKKWPVIFSAGFGMLTAGVYLLIFLFDDHIKNFDEIKDRYNLPVLGILCTDKKEYKGIDKYINKLENKEYNNFEYLKSSIKLLGEKNIMLCNSFAALNQEFDKLDSRVKVTGNLNNDKDSLDQLNKTDGVILVSKLWESKNSDIQRQIDIVNNASKKVVGVIGLD